MPSNGPDSQSQQQSAHHTEQNQQPHKQPQPHPQPPPQWWMAMQYQAAPMIMHDPMMPPQHYMPLSSPHRIPYGRPPHQVNGQQHQQPPHQESTSENKTIWVGDLQHWMDENYLHSCFASTGEVSSIKVIRNKQTGISEGYGFVEFLSHTTAEKVLHNYSTVLMPNTELTFRLNWATSSTGDKRSEKGSDLSIFVGDLAADVTDSILQETFASKYSSVKAAKVVYDPNTGCSKGYGFVRFGDDNERSQAMTDMNGVYCSSRPMRIGAATPKKSSGYQHQYSSQGYGSNGSFTHGHQSDGDSTNTTIFIGGLDPNVTDDDLRQLFSQHGDIVSVKIPIGKGCGFIQFANRKNAEEALQKLNGTEIGKQTVRLSWGRSPANKQHRADYSNQWSGAAYYGGQMQMYGGYGYAMPLPYDPPTMYAAASYGAYPMYGTHQQQVS
ncbi:polyadenylate-binding protein RBP47-like [Cucurbita pepo subsp. pepo]|uniref:polyadenylate-binding protein RBP47-like n=1 Tax=Cucurbita pepo subsp. pepo TaxID=3664 RepID=UPI000C9D9693|nr:polyadenylate-binding protein RBP47-like [Cucurbita pepo subsp. pepo]XP_023537624.1 polyadenylate-binding protein RBP47-like [Cucurbita pepo subsp. pepo]